MKTLIFSPHLGVWSSTYGWDCIIRKNAVHEKGDKLLLNFKKSTKARVCHKHLCLELGISDLRDLFYLIFDDIKKRDSADLKYVRDMSLDDALAWLRSPENDKLIVRFIRDSSPFDLAWDSQSKRGIAARKSDSIKFEKAPARLY